MIGLSALIVFLVSVVATGEGESVTLRCNLLLKMSITKFASRNSFSICLCSVHTNFKPMSWQILPPVVWPQVCWWHYIFWIYHQGRTPCQVLDWSSSNYMNVNIKKTKEMIICPSNSNVFSPLRVADVERVDVFKLLGVYINRSLKWDEHVRSICNKAASHIHF